LKEWYRGLKKRDSLRSMDKDVNEADDSILKSNQEYFKMHNISGTPTILIENYTFPKEYNISDLEFYIYDIRQLLTEKKKAGGLLAN
jgi:ATP-dependent RNA circularization protein (DNA/RNA ligase family)